MSESFKPNQETGKGPKNEEEVNLNNLLGDEDLDLDIDLPNYIVETPKVEVVTAQAEVNLNNLLGDEDLDLDFTGIAKAEAPTVEAVRTDPAAAEFINKMNEISELEKGLEGNIQ